MKNIEDYGFDRSDMIIATAVNSYLKNLTPDARSEALAGIVRYPVPRTSDSEGYARHAVQAQGQNKRE